MTKEEISDLFEPLDVLRSSKQTDRLIAFTIYSDIQLYNIGGLENIKQCEKYFPDWTLRFYVSEDSPARHALYDEDVDLFIMKKPRGFLGTFWRLEPISDPNYHYVLVRDTDQRVSSKDAAAVNRWLETDYKCHRMFEDESQTHVPLMACSIGFRTNPLMEMRVEMVNWLHSKIGTKIDHWVNPAEGANDFPVLRYGAEQVFLKEVVWPVYQDSCLTHGVQSQYYPSPYHEDFPDWDGKLDWGGQFIMRRITPGTGNTKIYGERPVEAYEQENR